MACTIIRTQSEQHREAEARILSPLYAERAKILDDIQRLNKIGIIAGSINVLCWVVVVGIVAWTW